MSNRKIRVLQLIDGLTAGGAERISLILATKINQDRFEVIPCALYRSGPLEKELKDASVRYRVLNLRRRSILTGPLFVADVRRVVATLSKVLKELAIDIIHAQLTESTLIGILAARQTKTVRVCASIQNVALSSQRGVLSPREWLMRLAINQVFSKVDRIIAVSEEVARVVRTQTRIPPERIVTIPNWIDPDRFRIQEDKILLRRQLGLPEDKQIVITVGRLTRQKGHPYLLAALASIPANERPVTIFAGDGSDLNELEAKAATFDLTDQVRFLGNRYDIPALLAAADLFVLPSLWEGLPLALLEAMASGLASVVTDVGGNSEVLENGKSGVIVPAADERALAEAMINLLKDPMQREQMGQVAREQFEQRFSIRGFTEAHERVYEEIVAGDPEHARLAA